MSARTHYDVILAPVVTEKSTAATDKANQIVFRVAREATKPQIKAAVEALWPKVKVKAVNTIVQKGKRKQFKGVAFKRSDYKKAIVTLREGDAIDIATGL